MCREYVFSVTIFCFPRRLEDVLKTSWKTKNSYAEDVFKTWWHVLKTSSRRIGDKQNFYWGYLHLANLNMYLANLYFTNLYLVNLRRIQNTLIRTQSGSRNEKNSGSGGSQVCNIVGHHSWPTKKIVYFKSSKTARKT